MTISPPYRVVGQARDAPAGCEIDAVAGRVAEFFTGVNNGDADISRKFFGHGGDAPFTWFSFTDNTAGGIGNFDTYSADSVNVFVARAYARRVKFVLRGIDFIGWVAERKTVAFSPVFFEYYVRDSLSATGQMRRGFGKGEYHCASSSFVVMSLGSMEERQWQRLFHIHVADSTKHY